MISATIESKFKTALTSLCTIYEVDVVGYWDVQSMDGNVQNHQPPFIRLAAQPPSSSAQANDNLYELVMNIEVMSLKDNDPKKTKFAYWADRVQFLLESIKGDNTTLASATYSEPESYTINGIQLDGGDMGYDAESKAWYINFSITIFYCKL